VENDALSGSPFPRPSRPFRRCRVPSPVLVLWLATNACGASGKLGLSNGCGDVAISLETPSLLRVGARIDGPLVCVPSAPSGCDHLLWPVRAGGFGLCRRAPVRVLGEGQGEGRRSGVLRPLLTGWRPASPEARSDRQWRAPRCRGLDGREVAREGRPGVVKPGRGGGRR